MTVVALVGDDPSISPRASTNEPPVRFIVGPVALAHSKRTWRP
jgi:hypothetical protein